MHPGALIPDIGHFEEILVETYLPNGLLKQRLVGAGRAGGNHYPVQIVFLHSLLYLLLGILGAGIEVLLHIDHILQPLGEFPYPRHIYDAADVDPAMADEDPDTGFLLRYILLGRVFLFPDEGPPDRGEGR